LVLLPDVSGPPASVADTGCHAVKAPNIGNVQEKPVKALLTRTAQRDVSLAAVTIPFRPLNRQPVGQALLPTLLLSGEHPPRFGRSLLGVLLGALIGMGSVAWFRLDEPDVVGEDDDLYAVA
jgi:hypothetical protein